MHGISAFVLGAQLFPPCVAAHQRHPTVLFLYLPQCKACGLYRGDHLILAGVDDAAGQKGSMLCQ